MKNCILILLIGLTAIRSWGQTCSGSLTSSTTTPCLNQTFTLTTAYHSTTAIVNWEVSENSAGPWTNIGTSNINEFSGVANFTITPTTSGVYYYRAVLPSCTYVPKTITVGGNPPPAPPIVTATTTCPNVTLTVPDGGTNTVAWYHNPYGFFWERINGQTGTSLVVEHGTGAYYATYENPGCASSPSNEISVGTYGIAPYVSTATSADINFVYNTGNSLVPQKDNCNKLLLSFEGSGNNRMKAKVTIDGTLNSYAGRPYLQRHYDLNPAPNDTYPSTPATYSTRLFFTQAEFDAFNAATSAATPKLPREPNGTYGHFNANGNFVADPTNSEIYYGNNEQVNVRVLKATGEPAVAGGGPDTYASASELENPGGCSFGNCSWRISTYWNSGYQVWQVTILNQTSFSGFFISTTNAALPVTLASFTARGTETAIDLNWQTSAETNFSHYDIQRSEQAVGGFEAIGRVNNQNNPAGATYSFHDTQAGVGQWYYYRLRMVDLDGTYQYSKIVAARIGQEAVVSVFPNPARSELTFTADEPVIEYQLISPIGRQVQRQAGLRTDRERVTLPSLPAGTYLLRLQMESGRTETRNVVIQ